MYGKILESQEEKSKKVEEKTQRTEEKVQKVEEKMQNPEGKAVKETVTELAKVEKQRNLSLLR